LSELNQTTVNYPARCIHELFEEQVEKTSDAFAAIYEDEALTYAELNARANQLAHLLRKHGVQPDDRVGLCLERSIDVLVGCLGIIKAGGAYVPLNPDHPKARLELQLSQSQASLCVTKNGECGPLEDVEIIDLQHDRLRLEKEPNGNQLSVTGPENLVYVIYTSGSTGKPKGVAVSHGNLSNYTNFMCERLAIESPMSFATVSPISADLGNTCIFPALVSGGCLHIISYDVGMEGRLFAEYLSERPIDVLKIAPSHLNALLSSSDGYKVLPVRYLIVGGEALTWDLLDRIAMTEPSCKLINHYGPTETTVGSLTFTPDKSAVVPYAATVPIGRPIANTRVYVLDNRLSPVPFGVAGELYISGAGVTRGYLNQPEETAARFVPDPYSNGSGRLYKTGDLVKYLTDGTIEFLGRVDHQVKVRGFRVELGEIEATLREYPAVRQAVAVLQRDSAIDERLVAYLVASGAKPPGQDDLRSYLKQKLPAYMVPSNFVFLKSLPLTSNGKVDTAALPAPDDARPDLRRTFVEPRTAVEKEVASTWAELLKLHEVGIHDNFFDLGGHSLLATQVISRMRKAFQLEIPLRSLFESPTVSELAEWIERATEAETNKWLSELDALSEEEAQRLLELEQDEAR
jgi:amino acid adenylation domain-containing protein